METVKPGLRPIIATWSDSKSAIICKRRYHSSRWNGVDAIESISICISSAEDEETTFLAANSDSWALKIKLQSWTDVTASSRLTVCVLSAFPTG